MNQSGNRSVRGGVAPGVALLERPHSGVFTVLVSSLAGLLTLCISLCSTTSISSARGEVSFPIPEIHSPVVLKASRANHWREGAYEVWWLRGGLTIEQSTLSAKAEEAMIWIDRDCEERPGSNKLIIYLDGDVTISHRAAAHPDRTAGEYRNANWLGRLYTAHDPIFEVPPPGPEPLIKPSVYENAMVARRPRSDIQLAQFQPFESNPTAAGQPVPFASGTRRLRLFTRGGVPAQIQSELDPKTGQRTSMADGGLNFIVDGLKTQGKIDISADRLVIWSDDSLLDLSGNSKLDDRVPVEIYLEGNIVFRQGETTIYAQRMYYDLNSETGTILDSELLTPIQDYQGTLRLRADVIQRLDANRFVARNAMLTSSRLGIPAYWYRAATLSYQDVESPIIDPFTGIQPLDPQTLEPAVRHERLATSRNSVLVLAGVPVFYWPVMATNLEDPTLYIDGARFKQDNIFGTRILLDWDAFEVLGIRNKPKGTRWQFSTDYLSDRGMAGGTNFRYERPDTFGYGRSAVGFIDAWGISDSGRDSLGVGRNALVPEETTRGRIYGRHRQQLSPTWQVTAELGVISDRNFLEQYFENEWDQFKDQTTGIELKHTQDNKSFSVTADARVNGFFTQTEWLPRLDHFTIGQDLFQRLTWFEHTQAGYGRLRTASTPLDPIDAASFAPLPWEVASSGERFVTRQELDFPINAGPVKLVPYALGELAHWGEDLTGNDLQRAYGQVGTRASIPFWTADSTVENQLFNVHGLAHKVVLWSDASYTNASKDLSQLPLYDPLDDDSNEHFRRRLAFNTFGGPPIPGQFDERFYALRAGLAGAVASPATEIADDITAVRFGVRQRWQTKRGRPGRRRIIDWVVLNAQAVWYPKPADDNFGEDLGLLNYDFRWHVGDRVTIVSDGTYDYFVSGQRRFTLGGFFNRPGRGNLYLGYRSSLGPIRSRVVAATMSYRMSPKWLGSVGTAVDLEATGNIGQNFLLTRIGESFLVSWGFTVDSSKNNVGVQVAIEPRFLPFTATGRNLGATLPLVNEFGLE